LDDIRRANELAAKKTEFGGQEKPGKIVGESER